MNHNYLYTAYNYATSNQTSVDDHSGGSRHWCFDQGYSSPVIWPAEDGRYKHARDQRALEENLAKVKNDWTKVKEEMGHAKQQGQHLRHALTETDKKAETLLLELEQADKCMRQLMYRGNDDYN